MTMTAAPASQPVIVLDQPNGEPGQGQRHGIAGTVLYRSMGMDDRLDAVLIMHAASHKKRLMSPGGKSMSESIVWLGGQRPLQ